MAVAVKTASNRADSRRAISGLLDLQTFAACRFVSMVAIVVAFTGVGAAVTGVPARLLETLCASLPTIWARAMLPRSIRSLQ